MFPQAPIAPVQLLERLGHEVVFPAEQTCCGQMHVNTGHLDTALPVVRHHVEVFGKALDDGLDAIVAPRSCPTTTCVTCTADVSARCPRRSPGWTRRRR